MMDWENLRYLLAFADRGTLLGAARALDVEHATVGRRLAVLEEQLGTKLIDRRGRKIQLTSDGQRVADMARRMEEQAMAIEQSLLSRERLAGSVRISAPPALSGVLLPVALMTLRHRHPDIALTVVGEKRYASLNRREADIAVRLTRPEQGDFTVLRLGKVAFNFYAAPAYLTQTTEPHWTFIAYGEDMEDSPQHKRLLQVASPRPIGLRASTLEFQRAAAQAGGGVAILPDFFVGPEHGLVQALVETDPVVRDLWLVVHSDIRDVPIIRAVMDAIKDGVRQTLKAAAGHDSPDFIALPAT